MNIPVKTLFLHWQSIIRLGVDHLSAHSGDENIRKQRRVRALFWCNLSASRLSGGQAGVRSSANIYHCCSKVYERKERYLRVEMWGVFGDTDDKQMINVTCIPNVYSRISRRTLSALLGYCLEILLLVQFPAAHVMSPPTYLTLRTSSTHLVNRKSLDRVN